MQISSTTRLSTFHCHVADKPTKPVITLLDKNPFVGDDITFKCKSEVRRWPGFISGSLIYKFTGRGNQHCDRLVIVNLTKAEHGANISCRAVDDLQKISDNSEIITLDLFCEFVIYIKSVNINKRNIPDQHHTCLQNFYKQ